MDHFDPKRVHFCVPFECICLRKGPKLGPQHSESGASLGPV
jgi:hypothetical protein